LRAAKWLLPAAILGLAAAALHGSLGDYQAGAIAVALRELPLLRLTLALAMAACGYLVLAGYDLLAFRFIGRRMRWRNCALASFLSNALGNNAGNILVTGAAVRYWIYSPLGIPAAEIAKIVLFCSLGFWLGVVGLGALLFIGAPIALPAGFQWPAATTRPLGFVLLALLGCYLALVGMKRTPVKLGAWQLAVPSPGLTASQLLVACLDLGLMGTTLYVLLPAAPDWPYPQFMAVFLLALVCGTASQVPGSLGVFETVVLLLGPKQDTASVAAALLAFRSLYFIVPLLVALAVIGVRERRTCVPKIRRLAEKLGRWFNANLPRILAAAVFFSGAVLLLSGALPAAAGRLARLHEFVPLPVIETSHFIASLAGAALLLVAHGIQRRLDAAYLIALALLATGAVLSLAKGWDYEEAALLGTIFVLLSSGGRSAGAGPRRSRPCSRVRRGSRCSLTLIQLIRPTPGGGSHCRPKQHARCGPQWAPLAWRYCSGQPGCFDPCDRVRPRPAKPSSAARGRSSSNQCGPMPIWSSAATRRCSSARAETLF
jgi:phosphatidylglycerol lysyltransferase